jgi:hypothetical protein
MWMPKFKSGNQNQMSSMGLAQVNGADENDLVHKETEWVVN